MSSQTKNEIPIASTIVIPWPWPTPLSHPAGRKPWVPPRRAGRPGGRKANWPPQDRSSCPTGQPGGAPDFWDEMDEMDEMDEILRFPKSWGYP